MDKEYFEASNKQFSDLPETLANKIHKDEVVTFLLEILTWIFIVFTIGFWIIFKPDDLPRVLPYIVFGMFLASAFWYLKIRTLYLRTHKEKLLGELHFQALRERQRKLDIKEKEFISMTSHQLNTPLSIIRNASSELMRSVNKSNSRITKKNCKHIQVINECSKRMISYLTDLISLVRSDQSILEINLQPAKVKEIIERSLPISKEEMEKKKLRIEIGIELNADRVICDFERTIIALANIIDNAVLYSYPKTTIEIRSKESGNYVQISVKNRGYGILPEEGNNVFQKFYRGSNARRINNFGTGLGLSTARDVIVQQGGTIWFESVPKKDTTFYFTLPRV